MEVAAAVVVNLYTIVGVWPKPLYVMVGILRKKNMVMFFLCLSLSSQIK